MILAGKDYGSGSSRDWAAKGPFLLGVKAVLAESYERIHRSNLVIFNADIIILFIDMSNVIHTNAILDIFIEKPCN